MRYVHTVCVFNWCITFSIVINPNDQTNVWNLLWLLLLPQCNERTAYSFSGRFASVGRLRSAHSRTD